MGTPLRLTSQPLKTRQRISYALLFVDPMPSFRINPALMNGTPGLRASWMLRIQWATHWAVNARTPLRYGLCARPVATCPNTGQYVNAPVIFLGFVLLQSSRRSLDFRVGF
jgi:hypothetical protein